jgi:hypothetical protein
VPYGPFVHTWIKSHMEALGGALELPNRKPVLLEEFGKKLNGSNNVSSR